MSEIPQVVAALRARVSDFPGPTCQDIDRLLSQIAPVGDAADSLSRRCLDEGDFSELTDFIREADNLLSWLPRALEDLRAANDKLRTALHEALESRAEAADWLVSIEIPEPAGEGVEEVAVAALAYVRALKDGRHMDVAPERFELIHAVETLAKANAA